MRPATQQDAEQPAAGSAGPGERLEGCVPGRWGKSHVKWLAFSHLFKFCTRIRACGMHVPVNLKGRTSKIRVEPCKQRTNVELCTFTCTQRRVTRPASVRRGLCTRRQAVGTGTTSLTWAGAEASEGMANLLLALPGSAQSRPADSAQLCGTAPWPPGCWAACVDGLVRQGQLRRL